MAIAHFIQNTYTGSLGDTVGAGWKGKKTWRMKPIKVHDKKSDGQIKVRNGFSVISKLAAGINEQWLQKYFGSVKKMSPYNLVLKGNKAFFGTEPLDLTAIVLPQNYLGAPTPPTVAPSISGQTVSLTLPAAATLAQGTVTEYLVAVFQLQKVEDAKGVVRYDGQCMCKVVPATASTQEVTQDLPIQVATGDEIFVYTQAGDGKKVNYSSAAKITVA